MNSMESEVFDSNIGELILKYLGSTYESANLQELLKENRQITEALLKDDIPDNPMTVKEITSNVFHLLESGGCNVLSPDYYGYVTPRPLPISVMGDWIAMVGNQTPGAWRAGPVATLVENTVIKWLAQFVNYKYEDSQLPPGIITSGGSMSNLSGLHLGRENAVKAGIPMEKLRYYVCVNAHLSVYRALHVLGATPDNIREIPVDSELRMDVFALKKQVNDDMIAGYTPAVIVATYGSTAIGAIDELEAIKRIAKEYQMWLHVDAASGGAFCGLDACIQKYGDISMGDSVSIDPSKWFFTSYGLGCLLVRDSKQLCKVYATESDYWEMQKEVDNFQMSFTCTRAWRTLGLYMSICQLGKTGYASLLKRLSEVADILQNELEDIGCEVYRGSLLPVLAFSLPEECKNCEMELIEKAAADNVAYTTLLILNGTEYVRVAISNYETKISNVLQFVTFVKKMIERN